MAKKVTLNGTLTIETYNFIYTVVQNSDRTFYVGADYADTHKHGEGKLYKKKPIISTFDNTLEWIRKTEREY